MVHNSQLELPVGEFCPLGGKDGFIQLLDEFWRVVIDVHKADPHPTLCGERVLAVVRGSDDKIVVGDAASAGIAIEFHSIRQGSGIWFDGEGLDGGLSVGCEIMVISVLHRNITNNIPAV